MRESIMVIICIILIFSCNPEKEIDGQVILQKSILTHDSLNAWNKTKLFLHIQEPRISNPQRYSLLYLDNSTNSFKLSRNRDQHISEHIINSNGQSLVKLDGNTEIDSTLVKKYRLDASRNLGYKRFYQLLYGLPMSLNNSLEAIISTSEIIFNGRDCYKIEIELKESVISKRWNLFVSKSSMEITGVDIIVPDKPDGGERIYFDGIVMINGIKIPRIRHWHELNNDTYSGSDLIVKEILQ